MCGFIRIIRNHKVQIKHTFFFFFWKHVHLLGVHVSVESRGSSHVHRCHQQEAGSQHRLAALWGKVAVGTVGTSEWNNGIFYSDSEGNPPPPPPLPSRWVRILKPDTDKVFWWIHNAANILSSKCRGRRGGGVHHTTRGESRHAHTNSHTDMNVSIEYVVSVVADWQKFTSFTHNNKCTITRWDEYQPLGKCPGYSARALTASPVKRQSQPPGRGDGVRIRSRLIDK